MKIPRFQFFGLMAIALLAAGCADTFGDDVEVTYDVPYDRDDYETIIERDGSILEIFGADNRIGNDDRGEAFAGSVNKHIWLASLDTLSFLPIASTDPFSGVIATDWGGATDSDAERFRVTAFVTSTALSPQSLKVAVFREVRDEEGGWVTAPVSAQTPRQIEDSILVRARQLRIAEEEEG